MMKYVPRELLSELEASGVPWHLEQGKRHIKIIVGKKFCGILPARRDESNGNRRTQLNIRAQVRRAIQEVKGG